MVKIYFEIANHNIMSCWTCIWRTTPAALWWYFFTSPRVGLTHTLENRSCGWSCGSTGLDSYLLKTDFRGRLASIGTQFLACAVRLHGPVQVLKHWIESYANAIILGIRSHFLLSWYPEFYFILFFIIYLFIFHYLS